MNLVAGGQQLLTGYADGMHGDLVRVQTEHGLFGVDVSFLYRSRLEALEASK